MSWGLPCLSYWFWDPLAILSAGFWLSFAGVAWLLWCMQDGHAAPWRGFLSAQGVATLGLLPFTVALFGQVSFVGPLANLIAIPLWTFVVVPLALLGTALEALVPGWGSPMWRLGGIVSNGVGSYSNTWHRLISHCGGCRNLMVLHWGWPCWERFVAVTTRYAW